MIEAVAVRPLGGHRLKRRTHSAGFSWLWPRPAVGGVHWHTASRRRRGTPSLLRSRRKTAIGLYESISFDVARGKCGGGMRRVVAGRCKIKQSNVAAGLHRPTVSPIPRGLVISLGMWKRRKPPFASARSRS
jgi:hypothetical protein